jgi:nitrogen regulatory protein P-II 1
MKRVEVTIPPANLDEVKDALSEVDVPGMTVHETRVFGRANRRREVYRGSSYIVDFALKVTVEMVVRDEAVRGILDVLETCSGSGGKDGLDVLITDVIEAVRIRTGERGEEAIDDQGVHADSPSPWSPATSPDRAS